MTRVRPVLDLDLGGREPGQVLGEQVNGAWRDGHGTHAVRRLGRRQVGVIACRRAREQLL
jgi:hypothetical protein